MQIAHYARRIDLPGSAPLPQLRHSIALAADSEEAMKVPEDFAAGYGRLVAQSGMLFGTRMYRHYTWLLTLSDHVAHFGLEHHESSDDRVDENSVSDAPLREGVAELLAHEYVHSWNGKYRRPAGLLSPDYQQPMDGTLLWVYEGMTQFWGTVLPVRAGLIPQPSYREMLASVAGSFDIQTGNRWRPLGRHGGRGPGAVRRAAHLVDEPARRGFLRGLRVPVAERGYRAAQPLRRQGLAR